MFREYSKTIFYGVLTVIVVIIVGLGLDLAGLNWLKFIGPKRQNIRTEIFRETRAYTESKMQDLARFRLQYIRADSSQEKEAIASTVRVMFAEFNPERIQDRDQREFLRKVMLGEEYKIGRY